MALRRPAAPAAAPAPVAPSGVSFGSLGFYSGGFQLPEGDWALEFNAQMFQPMKQTGQPAGPARLGVMVTAHPMANGDFTGGEAHEQFYSMGSKAHESFQPNPETGKGLVPVPGGPAQGMNNSTNWFFLLKSLYDCGMPEKVFDNDLSVLDGIWVHTQNVPEPEDRKGFGAKTGEAATTEPDRKPGLIAIVTEIKENGKPWESTGGLPEAAPVAAAPAALRPQVAKPGPKPVAARPVARPAPVAAPVAAAAEAGDEDVMTAAVNGVSAVLEKNPQGVSKLLMRTGTFKAVGDAVGAEMAQAVIDTFFGNDEALNSVLNQVGYGIAGAQVKVLA
jgi:hypothetical protein